MQSLPSYVLPAGIVLAVALVGAVIAFARDRARFSGYKPLMYESLRLAKLLNGELFRDGADLVVYGIWRNWPTQVRFSNSDSTPGLTIEMHVPATIHLFVAPKAAEVAEGRQIVRTTDEMLNARLSMRSDDATEASLLLDRRGVSQAIAKLCRSSQRFLRVTRGSILLADMLPPDEACVRGVQDELEKMNYLVGELRQLPGADAVVIEPLKRERRLLLRLAIVAGVVAIVTAGLIAFFGGNEEGTSAAAQERVSDDIWQSDVSQIPGVKNWRMASAANFDPEAVSWLKGLGLTASGRIALDFSGHGNANDVAYVLAAPGGQKRLVLLRSGVNFYDLQYPHLGIAARVPRSNVNSIDWSGTPPSDPDGDGLLILRAPNDPSAGIIIFTRGDRIITAVPKDYRNIRLE